MISVLFGTFTSHRADPQKINFPSDFMTEFVQMFKYGQYHAPSLHTYIMAFSLGMIFLSIFCYRKLSEAQQKKVLLTVFLWMFALLIAAFYGFYNSKVGFSIRSYLGPLESFQLDRIYWLYPTIWYVELALSLSLIIDIMNLLIMMI